MDCTSPPRIRQKVLILIRQDFPGRPYLEVYCADTIDVRIATLPFVGTKRGEILAEEVVARQLPWCYRELMDRSPRAHDVVSINKPSDHLDRQHQRVLLRALDGIGHRPRRASRAS